MKRIFWITLSIVLGLMFVFPQEGMCRRLKENLYKMLGDAKEVKTYVADPTDSSGQAKDMLPAIKKKLEDALATRMSINFVLVPTKEEADIVVTCDVTERIWMKEDPIDQIHGVGAAAMDIALVENYARLQALFTVERGGKKVFLKRLRRVVRRTPIIWQQELQATITKMDMPEADSIPLIEDRIIEVFMRKCFSKNAKI